MATIITPDRRRVAAQAAFLTPLSVSSSSSNRRIAHCRRSMSPSPSSSFISTRVAKQKQQKRTRSVVFVSAATGGKQTETKGEEGALETLTSIRYCQNEQHITTTTTPSSSSSPAASSSPPFFRLKFPSSLTTTLSTSAHLLLLLISPFLTLPLPAHASRRPSSSSTAASAPTLTMTDQVPSTFSLPSDQAFSSSSSSSAPPLLVRARRVAKVAVPVAAIAALAVWAVGSAVRRAQARQLRDFQVQLSSFSSMLEVDGVTATGGTREADDDVKQRISRLVGNKGDDRKKDEKEDEDDLTTKLRLDLFSGSSSATTADNQQQQQSPDQSPSSSSQPPPPPPPPQADPVIALPGDSSASDSPVQRAVIAAMHGTMTACGSNADVSAESAAALASLRERIGLSDADYMAQAGVVISRMMSLRVDQVHLLNDDDGVKLPEMILSLGLALHCGLGLLRDGLKINDEKEGVEEIERLQLVKYVSGSNGGNVSSDNNEKKGHEKDDGSSTTSTSSTSDATITSTTSTTTDNNKIIPTLSKQDLDNVYRQYTTYCLSTSFQIDPSSLQQSPSQSQSPSALAARHVDVLQRLLGVSDASAQAVHANVARAMFQVAVSAAMADGSLSDADRKQLDNIQQSFASVLDSADADSIVSEVAAMRALYGLQSVFSGGAGGGDPQGLGGLGKEEMEQLKMVCKQLGVELEDVIKAVDVMGGGGAAGSGGGGGGGGGGFGGLAGGLAGLAGLAGLGGGGQQQQGDVANFAAAAAAAAAGGGGAGAADMEGFVEVLKQAVEAEAQQGQGEMQGEDVMQALESLGLNVDAANVNSKQQEQESGGGDGVVVDVAGKALDEDDSSGGVIGGEDVVKSSEVVQEEGRGGDGRSEKKA